MAKLTKHERARIALQIGFTSDSYCRVCPNSGLNSPSRVCLSCPVGVVLRDLGSQLDSSQKQRAVVHIRWTVEDDDFLLRRLHVMPYKKIAEKMGRSYHAVAKRAQILREKGAVLSEKSCGEIKL